jgi:hypothetical protein
LSLSSDILVSQAFAFTNATCAATDWAPHFLVGVGVVLGFIVSAFAQATPAIFAVMCEHPALFIVLGVVVLAGRFT